MSTLRFLGPGSEPAVAVVEAIRAGDVEALRRLLVADPGLATARIGFGPGPDPEVDPGDARSLLHIVTDWPGHFPEAVTTVGVLIAAGADVDAPYIGGHTETPLHWAASSDDVEVLDALLDAGADIEADGAVIAGGPPLADAVAFGQWRAAARLVERGARPNLWQAAALGLLDRVEASFSGAPPAPEDLTNGLWCACHGGQLVTARYLLERGAERDWVGYDGLTPLDAAVRSGATELVDWLRGQGARSAAEVTGSTPT